MKRRIKTVLLLIFCFMSIAACTDDRKYFQFDVDCSVKFDYSCIDESKNFNSELDKENSKTLIEELNKISYVEEKEQIVFGPSYDCLTIFIGEDRLELADAKYVINDGGYITYNGKLCETSDNFLFLLNYINIE